MVGRIVVDNDRGDEDGNLIQRAFFRRGGGRGGGIVGARSLGGESSEESSFQATVKKTGAPLGVGHCKAVGNETKGPWMADSGGWRKMKTP